MSTRRIWDKGDDVDAAMMRYTSRDDWRLDQRLLPYDLTASIAHVRGLRRIGVLDDAERDQLVAALETLLAHFHQGELVLSEEDEDGHGAIEAALVAQLGDVGKKVHTGRSRNDQVLVALRLYQRDALDALVDAAVHAGTALLDRAEAEGQQPMVGFTHLQHAVPSTAGFWLGSVAASLADGLDMVRAVRRLVNRSPLGGAAGYGVNLPLDREGVSQELGFDEVSLSPMADQAARGVVAVQILTAAWQLVIAVRRLAWDLSLFTTDEFGFVKLDRALTTGSSIMPNKRNPDLVELMRASPAVVQGAIAELMGILSLPSGYHRDAQLTKAPLMRALDEALTTLRLVPRLVEGMTFDRDRMRASIDAACYATDRAVELTGQGVPFRDAYRQVASELGSLEGDPEASLRARVSMGGSGAPGFDRIRARLKP